MSDFKQMGYGFQSLEEILMDNGCAITKAGIKALEDYMAEYRRQVNVGADLKIETMLRDFRKVIKDYATKGPTHE